MVYVGKFWHRDCNYYAVTNSIVKEFLMNILVNIKQKIKSRDTVLTNYIYKFAKYIITFDMPPIKIVHIPIHILFSGMSEFIGYLFRIFYWKPVFILRLKNHPKRMNYYGSGLPYIKGDIDIVIGDDCRISAQVCMIGRSGNSQTPKLIIGNNVGIGWRTGIYVGRKIIIGDNVRIAGESSLSGYSGHPLDAEARARGEADTEDQVRTIILEDNVWLARGVTVNAGVRIGKNTVVAAGSVVTKDLPADVLAGGVPCKVIRKLSGDDSNENMASTLQDIKRTGGFSTY